MTNSLDKAAKFYRLSDPSISNAELADRLGLTNRDMDYSGYPFCTFYWEGNLAMIRTKPDEVAVFFLFQTVQVHMERGVGKRIEAEAPVA